MDETINNLSHIVNAFTAYNNYVTARPTAVSLGNTITIGLGNVGCILSHNLSDCLIALNETLPGDWHFRIFPMSKSARYVLNPEDDVSPLINIPNVLLWTKEISINISSFFNSEYNSVTLKCLNSSGLTVVCYDTFLDEQPLEKSKGIKSILHIFLALLASFTLAWIGLEKWKLKKL